MTILGRNTTLLALLLAIGVCLLAGAAAIDTRVAGWAHARDLGPVMRKSALAAAIKTPGDYRFTLVLAGLLTLISFKHWRGAVLMAASGAMAGLFYSLVKWSVGRTRPFPRFAPAVAAFEFHPFHGGLRGLWKAENQAFPSGHACLAFATAAALAMVFPRGRWWFFLGAAAVGVERVLEGAHYPSDVVGGAICGIAATCLSSYLLGQLEARQNRKAREFPMTAIGNAERGAAVVPVDHSSDSMVGN